MNVFKPFRTRSALRDQKTDTERFDRLSTTLAALREEVEREREGLRRRHDESCRDAAFALEALDQQPSSARLSEGLDRQSETIRNCERRLVALETQTDVLDRIIELAAEFVAK